MNRKSILLTILLCVTSLTMASPVTGLLERIDKGAFEEIYCRASEVRYRLF